jgi:hypothetical protein
MSLPRLVEVFLLESTSCPLCKSSGYEGFNLFHCSNPKCRYYTKQEDSKLPKIFSYVIKNKLYEVRPNISIVAKISYDDFAKNDTKSCEKFESLIVDKVSNGNMSSPLFEAWIYLDPGDAGVKDGPLHGRIIEVINKDMNVVGIWREGEGWEINDVAF